MRKMLIISALFAFSACTMGSKMADLREGMSPDQVVAALGQPDGIQRVEGVLAYQYANRAMSMNSPHLADYVVVFADDQLVQWGPVAVRQSIPNPGLAVGGALLLNNATNR